MQDTSGPIGDYLLAHTEPVDEVATWLLAETQRVAEDFSIMSVSEEQARFLEILTRAMGVTHAVEVGTFTGRSSLAIARGLADGGVLRCHDVSDEWTAVAREAWARAGVDDRIELTIGPATETLAELPDQPIDLAFIDADKPGYIAYYEAIVPRLRPGGIVAVDNVLWGGAVVDDDAQDDHTVAVRAFNDHATADERTQSVMTPIADGLSLHQRR